MPALRENGDFLKSMLSFRIIVSNAT